MSPAIIPVSLGFVKVFLVKGERTILVDAGLKGSSGRILRAMERNGIGPGDVSLILVTHAHADHTGGLMELKEATGAPVAAHRADAPFVSGGASAPVVLHSPAMKLLSVFFRNQRTDAVPPDVIIKRRLDLGDYGVDGHVIDTPGHTEGSVTLVTAAGEAIVGDMVGGTARPALPGVYADLAKLKESIRSLARHGVKTVHTCHGGAHTLADVLKLAD